jgi:hypothetical protein
MAWRGAGVGEDQYSRKGWIFLNGNGVMTHTIIETLHYEGSNARIVYTYVRRWEKRRPRRSRYGMSKCSVIPDD